MEITRSASGYLLIEYDDADVRRLNEDLGMRYRPHSGCLLCKPGGEIVWRNFPPAFRDNPPPLLLGWNLRDEARGA